MYIVSACLLGQNCKYNGGNNLNEKVIEKLKGHSYIALCPEEEGGAPTPRPPAEIREGRVYNVEGRDLTDELQRGAEKSLARAEDEARKSGERLELAILKAKSPSCGCGQIYDGTFSHKVVQGNGVFAELLLKNGIKVISEEEC